ncbi:sortase A [Blastococcus fimeti]|nr:sortase A [Blastococcus fimeti]
MRTLINGLLQLGLTAGVVVLLFVGYQTYVTDYFSDRQQEQVADDLRDAWDQPAVPSREQPDFGEGFAFLHIAALGADWSRAVVEGADLAELAAGPGHYAGTAMPGEVGNFAVAGHRNGNGAPFNDLDELQPGDSVVVETVDMWFTYVVTSNEIVPPSDSAVILPVPGDPTAEPTQAYLTLTTCHPEFSARERLIVHALLSSTVSKADSPDGPAALLASA